MTFNHTAFNDQQSTSSVFNSVHQLAHSTPSSQRRYPLRSSSPSIRFVVKRRHQVHLSNTTIQTCPSSLAHSNSNTPNPNSIPAMQKSTIFQHIPISQPNLHQPVLLRRPPSLHLPTPRPITLPRPLIHNSPNLVHRIFYTTANPLPILPTSQARVSVSHPTTGCR
ncbi:hypothetical protein CONLIGDRAFT_224579 [Coniochaeta ligniaria NRRL 30616]|uniref:Uncharacterized protein n=1 Tax=Coniochaeta ligniaria NRRL 30616 TaxID=1408157 RepID=A0A1J7IZQ2_9PEZI|nr:hypothetical protein CONLIGDRAFT_224579 [Coniochaeta ligniaria NRRL 30616]